MANIYDKVSAREAGRIKDPTRYNLILPTGANVEPKSIEDWLADINAQLGGGAGVSINLQLNSTAEIATTTIPAQVDIVTTLGYAAANDGGEATFKIVGSAPAHPGYRTSANGKICEITGPRIDIRALGGVAGGASGTSKQAYLDWINVGVATKIPLYIPPFTFDLGDAYITVSGPVNIRGEGKQSILKRSVRSGSASFGILLWINSVAPPILEQFQIEYAAATWPAHPGGTLDADAGANYALILTNCDGPILNEVHILGEWYVCFCFQDCQNIKSDHCSAKRYINRGLYITASVVHARNARFNQPVIDGHDGSGIPRADYGINFNTGSTLIVDCHINQPQVSGCSGHAIGISSNSWYCRVQGGSISNCYVGALIQKANGFSPQYCDYSGMSIEDTQFPMLGIDCFYCGFTDMRVNGTAYAGTGVSAQYALSLQGSQYCFVSGNRAQNMTVAGVICTAGSQISYGHVIQNNYIILGGSGTGFSSDATSQATWWTGNRVIAAATPFATLGTHPTGTNNITT